MDQSTPFLLIFLWAIVKCSTLYISAIISLGSGSTLYQPLTVTDVKVRVFSESLELLTAALLNIQIFCDGMPCILVMSSY